MGTIDLNDLDVFRTVVEVSSFSLAAKRLGCPKSTVSRAVARLEHTTGVRLLHRTTRRVSPSTAGKTLYDKVNLQLSALHRSIGNLPALEQELSGRLRVTMALDVEAVLAEVVERFVTRHPRVELELRLSNSYVDLVAEGMDLGLRFATRRLRDSSLRAKKLCPSVVHLYASPSYLVRRGEPRTPRDLDQHEWIVYRAATQFRLQSADRSVQVVTRGRIACDDMGFVRAAVGRGLGLGYLSPHFANNEVAAGRLVRVLPQWSCHISDLWAVWPGGHKLPRNATAFLGVLRETLGTDGFL